MQAKIILLTIAHSFFDPAVTMNTDTFALLKTGILQNEVHFVHTNDEYEPVTVNEPAVSVMTDFHIRAPCTTTENTNIQAALQQMKLSKVKSLFVLDPEDQVIGHISARDIQSTKPTLIAKEHDIKPTEITVKMMMTPTLFMRTLYFSELSNVRVGHIARLLHELQINYIFILEPELGQDKIRGMFSISRISRQLGENVMGDLSSHSVAEMSHLI